MIWVDFECFPGWSPWYDPEMSWFLDMGRLRLLISLDFLGFPWIWVDFIRIFMILQGFSWFWDDFACWFRDMACLRAWDDPISLLSWICTGWESDMSRFLDMTRSDGFEDSKYWILMVSEAFWMPVSRWFPWISLFLRWFSCFPDDFGMILLADCLDLPCISADSGRFLDSWWF